MDQKAIQPYGFKAELRMENAGPGISELIDFKRPPELEREEAADRRPWPVESGIWLTIKSSETRFRRFLGAYYLIG